jgi:hypothetical protein
MLGTAVKIIIILLLLLLFIIMQFGFHPLAVVILHVYNYEIGLLLNLRPEGYMRSMQWQLGAFGTSFYIHPVLTFKNSAC